MSLVIQESLQSGIWKLLPCVSIKVCSAAVTEDQLSST